MDISGSYTVSPYTSVSQSSSEMKVGSRPPPPPPEPVDGELSGYLSEVEDTEEVKSFMQEVMSMSLYGDFDAEELAEMAPDSLKAYAQEQGVDLEDMMQNAHDHLQQMGNKMPGGGGPMPPPAQEDEQTSLDSATSSYASIAQLGDSENDLMESLLSSLSIKTTA